ncbi:VOC family protein [Phenylobacterium sp. VNQ135]|uniref:VOC family protein n=1 Tax=Phenylobacterium sp. VNQ135 TaxID=3400922 RepID=UPI003C0457C2
MRNSAAAALALAAALHVGPAAAQAQGDWVNVRNARVAAADVAKAAAFYRAAFGMQEIQRYERPGFLEVILNFGRTVEEAKAAQTTRIALITRRPDQPADGVSNLVLNVGDMDRVMARVAAAGGTVEKAPARSAVSGNVIAMVRDPAGNRIELLMRP